MDDGKVNVMSIAMLQDLGAAFRQAEKDEAIVVLRSGRKDIFSAGFDLKVLRQLMLSAVWKLVTAGAELALHPDVSPLPHDRKYWKATHSRWERFCCWRAMCAWV